jgi:hypothetical protein
MIPITSGIIDEVLEAAQCDVKRGGNRPWPFPLEPPRDDSDDWPFEDVDGAVQANPPFESDVFVSFGAITQREKKLIMDRICQRLQLL